MVLPFVYLYRIRKESMIIISLRYPCVSVCRPFQLLEKLIDCDETKYERYVTFGYPTVKLLQVSIISDHNMAHVQTLEVSVTLGTLNTLKCHLPTEAIPSRI